MCIFSRIYIHTMDNNYEITQPLHYIIEKLISIPKTHFQCLYITIPRLISKLSLAALYRFIIFCYHMFLHLVIKQLTMKLPNVSKLRAGYKPAQQHCYIKWLSFKGHQRRTGTGLRNVQQISGGRLNKKDGLTRYGDFHVKDKTS